MSQSIPARERIPETWGFTLIEVVAALVLFATGVLILLNLSGSISRQMEFAAVASEMTSEAEQRIDSLTATPYASLTLGTTTGTMVIRGITYDHTVTITQYSPLLRQVEVEMEPRSGNAPSHTVYGWVADRW